jgi:hypothetical protein
MEKNPAERYATAQELADDVRRFLACLAQFITKLTIFGGRPTRRPRFFRSEDGQIGV